MSDSLIKKFFGKKKADRHFKRSGPGHVLGQDAPSPPSSSASVAVQPAEPAAGRPAPSRTAAHSQAAEAALARMSAKSGMSEQEKYKAKIRLEAKRRLERESDASDTPESPHQPSEHQAVAQATTEEATNPHVLFTCEAIGLTEPRPLSEAWQSIRHYLYDQYLDPDMQTVAAALIVRSLNSDDDAVEKCVALLCKYITNLASSPSEVKFHRIRTANKAFAERVGHIEGHELIMSLAGFRLSTSDDGDECWLVSQAADNIDVASLTTLADVLRVTEPVRPEFSRAARIVTDGRRVDSGDVDDAFFDLSVDEVKRMQLNKTEALEREKTLRTQSVRDAQSSAASAARPPKYMVIRIKLPDSTVVQGTFRSREPISAVYAFVASDCLTDTWAATPFALTAAATNDGSPVDLATLDAAASLSSSGLFTRFTLLTLVFAAGNEAQQQPYLRPDLALQ